MIHGKPAGVPQDAKHEAQTEVAYWASFADQLQ